MIKKHFFVILALFATSCAHYSGNQTNVAWIDFEQYRVHNYNQAVFINITAKNCADCQYISKRLLKTSKFAAFLANNDMIAIEARLDKRGSKRIEKWLADVFYLKLIPFPRPPLYIIFKNNDWLTFHKIMPSLSKVIIRLRPWESP